MMMFLALKRKLFFKSNKTVAATPTLFIVCNILLIVTMYV